VTAPLLLVGGEGETEKSISVVGIDFGMWNTTYTKEGWGEINTLKKKKRLPDNSQERGEGGNVVVKEAPVAVALRDRVRGRSRAPGKIGSPETKFFESRRSEGSQRETFVAVKGK